MHGQTRQTAQTIQVNTHLSNFIKEMSLRCLGYLHNELNTEMSPKYLHEKNDKLILYNVGTKLIIYLDDPGICAQ